MKYLRTVSTRRLLALIAGLVAAVAGGTAIAIAAAGNGPLPAPSSLAGAVHRALSAPAVDGLSARISFTNNLISSSNIETSDPIITGASGRLWIGGGRLRLELQSSSGDDAQIVVDHSAFWISDPSTNTVYEGTLPSTTKGAAGSSTAPSSSSSTASSTGAGSSESVPTIDQIQSELTKLAAHLDISGPQPSDFGGAAAYTVQVSPKHDGGLLGSVQLAWDAARGVPLDFAIYAAGNSSPVLALQVTGISYGPVDPSVFALTPPAGATVVKIAAPAASSASTAAGRARRSSSAKRGAGTAARRAREVTGAGAVAAALPFSLDAPGSLDGLPQRSVQLLDWGSSPAALVLYGQGLGGVAVIERAASRTSGTGGPANGAGGGELSLPTVDINGVTGEELDTALGAAVQFDRAGVSYLVIGSVSATVAEDAARQL